MVVLINNSYVNNSYVNNGYANNSYVNNSYVNNSYVNNSYVDKSKKIMLIIDLTITLPIFLVSNYETKSEISNGIKIKKSYQCSTYILNSSLRYIAKAVEAER